MIVEILVLALSKTISLHIDAVQFFIIVLLCKSVTFNVSEYIANQSLPGIIQQVRQSIYPYQGL